MLHPPVLSVEKMCVPLPPKCIYPRQRNIVIREMVRQSHMITTVSRSLTSTKMAILSIVVSFALENFPALTRMNVTDWQPFSIRILNDTKHIMQIALCNQHNTICIIHIQLYLSNFILSPHTPPYPRSCISR